MNHSEIKARHDTTRMQAEVAKTIDPHDESYEASDARRIAMNNLQDEECRLRTVLSGVLAPLPIMHVEIVTIPKADYSNLCADSHILNCLRNAGVDNWEWFDDAMAEYYKEIT